MKILVSDFDNTFFNKDYIENINKVNDFVNNGNMFIIATGRSINNLKQDINDLNIKYSFLICSDGASIYDNKHNNLYCLNIDQSLINSICEYLENDKNIIFTLIENDDFVSGTRANSIAAKYIDYNKAAELSKNLNENFSNVYSYLSENYINIRNINVSKGKAIEFLINKYNFDRNDIYTIGDSVNDLDMCKNYNGISFDFANEELKKNSKYIVSNFNKAVDLINSK